MITRIVVSALLTIGVGAMAQNDGARQKLLGFWQLQAGDANGIATTWTFQEDGGQFRVAYADERHKPLSFVCNTVGRECAIKHEGKEATVSLWFNGPKLVELEVRGSEIVKRRFAVSDNSDSMDVEIIPVAPAGKSEVLHFRRVETGPHS